MRFSKIKNKHKFKASFSPAEFIGKYRKNLRIPHTVFLLFQEYILFEIISNKYEKIPGFRNVFKLNENSAVFFSPIGAAACGTNLEELIEAGAKRIIIIGTAGGINPQKKVSDIVLCSKALIDEGFSRHYSGRKIFSRPALSLNRKLEYILNKKNIKFDKSATWTIDAPYRETIDEVKSYASQGISTVDMEASAVFTLAEYRGIEAAALFVISDVLQGPNKGMFFEHKKLKKVLADLFFTMSESLD